MALCFSSMRFTAFNKSQQDALLGAVEKGVIANWRHYRKSFFRGQWRIAFPMSGFTLNRLAMSDLRSDDSAGLTQDLDLKKLTVRNSRKQMPLLRISGGWSKTLESPEIVIDGIQ